ncbi:unnamed protein product [Symbiodinium necroappetens]|uniref:Uncharacterized protein n=1 Tax=Symbiodinium necroappetens TaxID=1628268 RepID=A0A813A8J2_9DINO|nr:unnamed protein product [Symbiodinium necroappetens]
METAVFSEVLPFGLSSRLGAGSAAAARGYVPRMPLAVRDYTCKRFGIDCGLDFLRRGPGDELYAPREWHEDAEWISELCRSLRLRDNVADPPSRGKDVAPPSREMARWLTELLKGDTRRFETVVESVRAGFAASTAHKITKSFRAFLVWLKNEAQCNSEAVFSSAEATAMALRGYGLHLYETGMPRYLLVYAITAVQDKFPQHRNFLTAAWQVDKKWQRAEPGSCRAVLPVAAIRACVSLSLLWGWSRWCCLLIIGFLAMLHPAELLLLERRDLVFPSDTLGHTQTKTSEFYLQEVAAQVLLTEISPAARSRIKSLDDAADSLLAHFSGASQY